MKGLGAVLLQEGRPVIYVSRTLTPAEERYSNIERELLGLVFGMERLPITFMANQHEFRQITNRWKRFGRKVLLQQAQDYKGYF